MLHNSGPYGPNDVPINMGAPVNMTQMSSPMNLGNNLSNLAKIPQQTPQTSAPHYNMPDYSSFGHPPLNIGHSISPFANYHHMNFQANYGQPNPNVNQDTTPNNVQNSMLPMNLNVQSDHGPSLMNYHNFESKRFDVNNSPYKESFSRKMPINIPQLHTKAFHKHAGMDAPYGQYNSMQETPSSGQDSTKTPERTLLDDNRRKSLENTVKLIENILINSTPKEKLKNLNNTDYLLNTHSNNSSADMSNTISRNSVDNNKKSQNKNLHLYEIQNQSDMSHTDVHSFRTEILNKTADNDDFKINLKEKIDISDQIIDLKTTRLHNTNVNTDNAKSTKHSKIHTDNSSIKTNTKTNDTKLTPSTATDSTMKIQSEIHCAPLRRSLLNNNRITVDKTQKDTSSDFKKDTSDNSKYDTESECNQAVLHIHIKEEIQEEEEEEEDTVKVKMEPLESDGDNLPFLRDANAISRDMIEEDALIVAVNNVAEAQEAMKKGSYPKTYYECSYCSLLFKHPKWFLIHSKWHSFGLTNEKRQELVKEKEAKKNMKKEAKNVERLNSKEVKEGGEGESHPCKDCDKVFAVKSSLKNHRQRYHPTRVRECKICNVSVVGWMALRAHTAAHTGGGGYQCPECPKRFKYAHSLAKHKDTHLEKTLGCTQCEKKFGSQALLKMHMKCHERTARGATFRCTYCAKGFFESYNLQVHERTHRNERPFLCEICKTSFGTNSSLKRHLKVSHSKSKPFPCPTCQRCFASATTRARHTARAHGDPSTFAHACQICPRRYRALKELHKHISKAHAGTE